MAALSPRASTSTEEGRDTELRRRISYLMLYRVVLITLVLGVTVVLDAVWPKQLASPASQALFAIIIVTYLLSIGYAFWLPKVARAIRFADAQLAGDLIITTLLVHLTGGAQSGYTFFYPLSIVGAATVRYRGGAIVVATASVGLFVAVALAGWLGWLPTLGETIKTDVAATALMRQLVLNVGACVAIGMLAANLGEQIARSSRRLDEQRAQSADLTALKEDIIRSLSSGLVTIDRDGKVMTLNEAAAEILGVAAGGVVGTPVHDLLPQIEPLVANLGPADFIRRGEIGANRAPRPGAGTRTTLNNPPLRLGISVSPLVNHRGAPIGRIINFQDLTELRLLERDVKRAERLAVIGGVAAGVAHEIRNPLQSISGCIELLRAGPEIDPENRALMDIVLREVDRLNSLLTDLLDYARPRDWTPMRLDLGAVIDETLRVFAQDRTYPRLELVHPPAAAEIAIDGDPGQLRQVVWNLLRNAAEAMPDGGKVTVGLEHTGSWAELTVSDNGVGISAEDQERIFEPFFTTKPGGNGLGLPLVHRIVTEHGGTISLKSAAGRGTAFRVRLPAV